MYAHSSDLAAAGQEEQGGAGAGRSPAEDARRGADNKGPLYAHSI